MSDLIEIPIKEGSKHIVRFTDSAIEYNGTTIEYTAIVGIKFWTTLGHSTALDSTASQISIRGRNGDRISITMSARRLFLIGPSFKSNYRQIVDLALQHIGSPLFDSIVRQILTPGQTFRIGSLIFDSNGITCEAAFGVRRHVTWEYKPQVRVTSKIPLWQNWSRLLESGTTRSGIFEISYFYPANGKMIVVGAASSRDENGIFVPRICEVINSILNNQ